MARTQHQLVLQTKVHNGVDSDKSRGSILNMSTTSGETEIQLHLHLLLVVELLLQLQETRMLESLLHLQGGKLEAEHNRLKSSQNLLICWNKRLKPQKLSSFWPGQLLPPTCPDHGCCCCCPSCRRCWSPWPGPPEPWNPCMLRTQLSAADGLQHQFHNHPAFPLLQRPCRAAGPTAANMGKKGPQLF